tara:strand:+ start:133 stop:384 length:252 start_codon:yes stop_codon:yes gene_type:complete
MKKTKFIFEKLARLVEQGITNYNDISDEIISVLKSKRDEIVFKMKLTSKDETDILSKRIDKLEKKIENIEKRKKTKSRLVRKS